VVLVSPSQNDIKPQLTFTHSPPNPSSREKAYPAAIETREFQRTSPPQSAESILVLTVEGYE
jgi:hypothetical protein